MNRLAYAAGEALAARLSSWFETTQTGPGQDLVNSLIHHFPHNVGGFLYLLMRNSMRAPQPGFRRTVTIGPSIEVSLEPTLADNSWCSPQAPPCTITVRISTGFRLPGISTSRYDAATLPAGRIRPPGSRCGTGVECWPGIASLSFPAATDLSSCCACILQKSPSNKPNGDQSLAADLWSAPAPIVHAASVNDGLVDGLGGSANHTLARTVDVGSHDIAVDVLE